MTQQNPPKVVIGYTVDLDNEKECDEDSKWDWQFMPFVKCPFCDDITDNYAIQEHEYTTKPMLWHNCGARSVLDEESFQKISFEEASELCHSVKLDEKLFYYSISLLYIYRISNYQLYHYERGGKNQDTELLEEDIRKLCDFDRNDIENENPELLKLLDKMGLVKIVSDDRYDPDPGDNYDFELSLPVNSYNDNTPKIPYPEKFDTSHDGPSILLKCEDEIQCRYWGD